MSKFTPMKARCRASFSAGVSDAPRFEALDKEAEVLRGVQITLEGEALGHDVWLDREFCEAVAAAGNAAGEAGVKVRFGHPAMCSDALGTYLGRAHSFRCADVVRKDGSVACGVFADVTIDPSAHKAPQGDLAAWIMSAAETAPDTFGQSIVFTYADWVVKSADGVRHSYNGEVLGEGREESAERLSEADWIAQSADGRTYAVLGKLLGTDFTDTPAATDGVFSADSLAAQAEEFLAENPIAHDMLEKHPDSVVQFLSREGFWDRIESKRCANLQSAFQQRINELEASLAAETEARAKSESAREEAAAQFAAAEPFKAECERFAAEVEALKAAAESARGEIESLSCKLAEAQDGLAKANAEASAARAEAESTASALSRTEEQLKRWEENAATLASRVNVPPAELKADWKSSYRAARKSKITK